MLHKISFPSSWTELMKKKLKEVMININPFQKSYRCRLRVESWIDSFVWNCSAESPFTFYLLFKNLSNGRKMILSYEPTNVPHKFLMNTLVSHLPQYTRMYRISLLKLVGRRTRYSRNYFIHTEKWNFSNGSWPNSFLNAKTKLRKQIQISVLVKPNVSI